MNPRHRIVAIAAATNAVFVVPMVVVFIDIDRTCSLRPYGCEGYQYFGAAAAFMFAIGPGTAAALASALLTRWLLARRRDIGVSAWSLVGGTVVYWVIVIGMTWMLRYRPWVTPVVMALGLPGLLLLSTRPNARLRSRQFSQERG